MSDPTILSEAYRIARGETMLLPTVEHLKVLAEEIERMKDENYRLYQILSAD